MIRILLEGKGVVVPPVMMARHWCSMCSYDFKRTSTTAKFLLDQPNANRQLRLWYSLSLDCKSKFTWWTVGWNETDRPRAMKVKKRRQWTEKAIDAHNTSKCKPSKQWLIPPRPKDKRRIHWSKTWLPQGRRELDRPSSCILNPKSWSRRHECPFHEMNAIIYVYMNR